MLSTSLLAGICLFCNGLIALYMYFLKKDMQDEDNPLSQSRIVNTTHFRTNVLLFLSSLAILMWWLT